MSEQSRVLTATLIGAAVGGLVGCVYLTDAGRRFLAQLEPRLDEIAAELGRWRRSLAKAQSIVCEAWRSLGELAGEEPQRPRGWVGQNRQASL
jgi:hypothetical protein